MDLCGFESLSVWITIKICRRAGGYGPECGKGPENTFPDFAFNYGGVIKSRAARSKLPRPSLKLEPWESGRNSPGCARPTGLKWSTGGGLGAGRQVAMRGKLGIGMESRRKSMVERVGQILRARSSAFCNGWQGSQKDSTSFFRLPTGKSWSLTCGPWSRRLLAGQQEGKCGLI